MEYPHWMMLAGTILVAVRFIGLAFHRNRNGRERVKSYIPEPERDDLPAKDEEPDVGLVLWRSDKH
jgi:hypothetical protein